MEICSAPSGQWWNCPLAHLFSFSSTLHPSASSSLNFFIVSECFYETCQAFGGKPSEVRTVGPACVSSWPASFPAAASVVLPPDSCSRLLTRHKTVRDRRGWMAPMRFVVFLGFCPHRHCWDWWTRRPSLCSAGAPLKPQAPPPLLLSQSEVTISGQQHGSYSTDPTGSDKHRFKKHKQRWLTSLDLSSFFGVRRDDGESFVTETEKHICVRFLKAFFLLILPLNNQKEKEKKDK